MPSNDEILISLDNLSRYHNTLTSAYGAANGVAQLDANSKVPTAQLPSAVFNVEEYNTIQAFPLTGESGKIYIDRSTNNQYRWNGTDYVSISSPESVKYIQQTLTSEQKSQARTNIGAAADGDIPTGVVQYDITQELTTEEKARARSNIGAASPSDIPSGTVRYDEAQDLTFAEKEQARSNIGAASVGDIPTGTVRYDETQELTLNQMTQARTNIDAASNTEFEGVSRTVATLNNKINNFGNFVREVNGIEGGGLEVVYDNAQVVD